MKAGRAIVLIFAMLMLLASLPLGASAANTCGEHVSWTLSGGVLEITGSGAMYNWKSSSDKAAPWYESRTEITSVVINTGVTTVGSYAFYGCTALTSVTLPEGLKDIGDDAFDGCKALTDLKLPSTLETLGRSAFSNMTHLMMITIPGGVKTLPAYLFHWSSGLHDIAIPRSVKTVSDYAFDCGNLCDVHYEGTQEEWDMIAIGSNANGALTGARLHCEASVDYVPYTPGVTCGRAVSHTLKDGVLTVSVDKGFSGSGSGWMWDWGSGGYDYDEAPWHSARPEITSAVFESGIRSIGDNALYNCVNLTGATLPEGLVEIGASAFEGCRCKDMTDLRLPSTVTKLGRSAFSNMTYLMMITIPSGVKTLPAYLFHWSSGLHDIAIPRSVTSIGNYALDCSNLCDVHYEGTREEWNGIAVGKDGNGSLAGARIHCEASVDYVPYVPGVTCGRGLICALNDAGVLTVSVDEGFTGSGSGWMWNWGSGGYDYDEAPWYAARSTVKKAVLGEGVRCIGENAFYGYNALTDITVPISVELIEKNAFYRVGSLTDVWYGGTIDDRYELITVRAGNERLDHEDCIWHYLGKEISPFRIDALKVLNASGAQQSAVPAERCYVRLTVTRVEQRGSGAMVLLAAYDASGRLAGELLFFEVEVPLGATSTVTLPVDNSSGEIKSFKAFVIRSFTDFTPLGEAVSFP